MSYTATEIINGITEYKRTSKRNYIFYAAVTSFIFWFGFFLGINYNEAQNKPLISPLPERDTLQPTLQLKTDTLQHTVAPLETTLKGTASYYSVAGCLGCSETLTMANGEVFTDEGLTIALTPETVGKHKLLNDTVIVRNVRNGQEIKARVTDTGGFAKYNRIADLGVAVKNAIGCSSLCEVQIEW